MTIPLHCTPTFYEYRLDSERFSSARFQFGTIGTGTDSEKVFSLQQSDSPVADTWRPLVCEALESDPPRYGDFPSVTNYYHVPLISERAWRSLSPLVGQTCEALPVFTPFPGSYFLLHVLRTIDALDVERSEVSRVRSRPELIRRVYKYAFKPHLLDDVHLFKLPMNCDGGLFFDDVFRDVVESNGLLGLKFVPLNMVEH